MVADTSTSGVQELIDRLSQEGVAEGQRQAEEIVTEARRKAANIVETARSEADSIRERARADAEHFRTGGEEAVGLACRDAQRELASRLHETFRARLQELVRHQLQDPELLNRMILEILGKAKPSEPDAEIIVLLPPEAIQEGRAGEGIEAEDVATAFVKGIVGDGLRRGFNVAIGDTDQAGLRIQVLNENVEIDFTDQAITQLLASHLLPRFRAILRG